MQDKAIYCILMVDLKQGLQQMLNTKKLAFLLSLFVLFSFTACTSPSFGKKVEKEYYTGGKLRSEFIWSDSTGRNGVKKTYGFEGHQTSTIHITNGVKNGMMTIFDKQGRVMKQTPYVNGKIQGVEKAFYPNGDRMITFTYQNGMKNGYAYSYYPSGQVCRKAKYKNNRLLN